MSVSVITRLSITRIDGMGRWEPDARGRLLVAALELFADGGFERATVADIAERAGVTERTFFRHFTDKREVLFEGASDLQHRVVSGIEAAPPDVAPLDTVAEAFAGASGLLEERREFAGRRAAVIASNPSLQERELLKMAALGVAAAAALRSRGVEEPVATLAAESGVTVFRVAFERWVGTSSADLASCIRTALTEMKALTARS
jgi:AcrR family transcriptional regulator